MKISFIQGRLIVDWDKYLDEISNTLYHLHKNGYKLIYFSSLFACIDNISIIDKKRMYLTLIDSLKHDISNYFVYDLKNEKESIKKFHDYFIKKYKYNELLLFSEKDNNIFGGKVIDIAEYKIGDITCLSLQCTYIQNNYTGAIGNQAGKIKITNTP